jgi:hypothetical protein
MPLTASTRRIRNPCRKVFFRFSVRIRASATAREYTRSSARPGLLAHGTDGLLYVNAGFASVG